MQEKKAFPCWTYGVILGSLVAIPLYATYIKVNLETPWSTAFTSASVLSLAVVSLWMISKAVIFIVKKFKGD